MKTPDNLDTEGKRFFKKHSARLEKAGLLTGADIESFTLLCMTWSKLVAAGKGIESKDNLNFNSLSKSYLNLAKQFGLMPKDRKKSGLEVEQTSTDEFGIG